MRKQRGPDVETLFGDIKHNMGVRRFLLRRLKKVEAEWGLLSVPHNLRKLAVARPPVFCLFSFTTAFAPFASTFLDTPLLFAIEKMFPTCRATDRGNQLLRPSNFW